MKMKMKYGLTCVRIAVEDGPIAAIGMAVLPGNERSCPHHFSHQGVIRRREIVEACNMTAWDDEHVRRRPRSNVFEYDDVVVLVNDSRRNLPGDQLAEKTVAHITS